ncbi:alginate export family protein [Marinimicrobium sp. ABcell2]|uniref:alginate export family protein n=1 Tax=Marinimicrobium sp. ABcell2 TaxID=3069751 RepID=UPI0027B6EBDC|nr:alginate export family protein [Marinimicrobium sp. ABcell2]MDQ2075426.1 alginate export family protein [Marinimicrobium sp. ABcell2]
MKKTTLVGVTTALALTCFSGAAVQAQTDLSEALSSGEVGLNFRLRYEDVSWDGLSDSDALTLRTRLSYTSGSFHGFRLMLEMDDVTEVGTVDYRTALNDTENPGTAIIADPEGTEVNQAYFSYTQGETEARLGRQRILLDNQRFVGGVGWRQNEQTYDAFSVRNESLADTTLFYAYVDNVNRIFGEQNVIGDHRQDTHLFNAQYRGFGVGKLTGYAYLIDNESAPALSSDTFGVRWLGTINPQWSYTLEYAIQSDAGDSPLDYSTDYMLAEVAGKFGPVSAKVGYEVLGSDDGEVGFATPLATLHAFQGWTDRFLETPGTGIEDIYVSLGAQLAGINFGLAYHDLSSNEGSISYGREIGFSAAKRVGPVNLLLKYADYSANDFGSDTQKLWLMAEASF